MIVVACHVISGTLIEVVSCSCEVMTRPMRMDRQQKCRSRLAPAARRRAKSKGQFRLSTSYSSNTRRMICRPSSMDARSMLAGTRPRR